MKNVALFAKALALATNDTMRDIYGSAFAGWTITVLVLFIAINMILGNGGDMFF